MTRISRQSFRVMWMIVLSAFALVLLVTEAASAPLVAQVAQTGQTQSDNLFNHTAAQDVSDALGARLDHMMQDGKPLRQR